MIENHYELDVTLGKSETFKQIEKSQRKAASASSLQAFQKHSKTDSYQNEPRKCLYMSAWQVRRQTGRESWQLLSSKFLTQAQGFKTTPIAKGSNISYIAVRKFYMALKPWAQAISFTVHSEMRPPWQTAFFRWSLRKICRLAVFSQPLLISCAKDPVPENLPLTSKIGTVWFVPRIKWWNFDLSSYRFWMCAM